AARQPGAGTPARPPLPGPAPPDGPVALALCLDAPDAGRYPFTHWLAWGLPPEAGALEQGEPAPSQGRNDFGAPGYRGPCPPPGQPHRYVFPLYALHPEPELGPSGPPPSFAQAIDGHRPPSPPLA